ncbi:MAG: DUF3459 domain-containing protein [Boseongicola sp. SB0677_bin_26]|nr:DUF3459 domain-containing protein [Boseongicola sp. SB0665_bin_10]MYG28269.1 DUF3459 domain-containing protein [Boseongicola sp. SB0677_bin_26]
MTTERSEGHAEWWRGACIYEVYLRSFMDSDGDGEGDLRGLLSRMDYLAGLGIDAIWITPFFPSPMHDSGYDVSDYRQVDPRFGTLEDFREVVQAAHGLGLKVVIDQVYSHSSHRHPWFVESRSGKDGARADWYVWADAKADGGPPNNWLARFGGVAWAWVPERRQYYLHNFLVEQPDLNLHNMDVQDEVLDIMTFWFDLGVDGLRLDVANFFMHDPALRDNPAAEIDEVPANPYYMQQRLYDRSRPENLPFLERMRNVAGDRMLLAEISCDWQVERMSEYTAPDRLHTAYSFSLLAPELNGSVIADTVLEAGEGHGWPTWAFSNHDVCRVASRWGAEDNPARVTMLHALLLSLRGTVILYQGEELGLSHSRVPREAIKDPEGIRFWPHDRGRDGARTPFPWDDTDQLGFSKNACTWLPCEPSHAALAVARQDGLSGSILENCRALIALRRANAALRYGMFEPMEHEKDWLVFCRIHDEQRLMCAFNFSDSPRSVAWHDRVTVLSGEHSGAALPAHGYVIAEEN